MEEVEFNGVIEEGWLETVLSRHQEEGLISRVLSLDSSPAVPEGENYLSIVSRVKANVILRSGRKAAISLIMKIVPDGEGKRKLVSEMGAFKRETTIYLTVLKELENIMFEYDDKDEKLWPDLVAFRPYDMLMFDDLSAKNFIVPPRAECQDLNHALLSMTEMGRFHAMTKVLLMRGTISASEFPAYFLATDEKVFCGTAGASITRMGQLMQSNWGPEWVELGIRVEQCVEKLKVIMPTLGQTSDPKFQVLNHGDPWTCNMLFKYSSYDRRPIALRFIDFQLAHVDTFAWDLTYYLFSSVEPDIRRENLTLALQTYSESFQTSLTRMGVPTEEIPTYDDILDEMERLAPLRVTVMCFFHLIMTAKFTDAYDLEASMNSIDDKHIAPRDECFLSDRFIKRVGPDIETFAEQGLI